MTACQGGGGAGVRLTYAQLEGVWISNGGPRAAAPVAAAIALAESSGCSTALNPSDNNGTQSSFGLWQISNGTHNPPVANIYDPNVNAKQAVAKYRASGWAPWGTYASGAYRPFLNNATTPDMSIPGGSGTANATLTSATSAAPDPTCAASWPTISLSVVKLPLIPNPSVGGGCIIHKATLRHVAGGLIMVAGGLVVLPGVLVLAAFAFRASGAQRSLAALPGPYGGAARQVSRASPAARAPQPAGPAPQAAGDRKIRTNRGQVSEDFASRYGTAPPDGS